MEKPQVSKLGDCTVLRQQSEDGDQIIRVSAEQAEQLMGDLERVSGSGSHADVPTGLEAEEERQDSFGRL